MSLVGLKGDALSFSSESDLPPLRFPASPPPSLPPFPPSLPSPPYHTSLFCRHGRSVRYRTPQVLLLSSSSSLPVPSKVAIGYVEPQFYAVTTIGIDLSEQAEPVQAQHGADRKSDIPCADVPLSGALMFVSSFMADGRSAGWLAGWLRACVVSPARPLAHSLPRRIFKCIMSLRRSVGPSVD